MHSHDVIPRVEDKVGGAEDDEGGVGEAAVAAAAAVDDEVPEAGGDGRPEGAVVRVAVAEVFLGDGRHRVAVDVGARRGPARWLFSVVANYSLFN